MPMPSPAGLPPSSPRRLGQLWRHAAVSSWPSAAATPRGKCCVRWQEKKFPWEGVHLVQVDERVAPTGDPDRNFTHLRESLLEHAPLRPEQIHDMPVEEPDLGLAATRYALMLREIAGVPPVLDLAHLGLGPDGHTASLVPGDPVLNVTDADVALTEVYQGRRRMTLTYPMLNRSRRVLWLVTGSDKAEPFVRLRDGDPSIPAGRVRQDQALVLADRAAAGLSGPEPTP